MGPPDTTDRGSTVPAVLVVLIGAVLTVSLAIEIGRFTGAVRQASYVADLAAEAAATAVDERSLELGGIALDRQLAIRLAEGISNDLDGAGNRSLSVSLIPTEVCIDVVQVYRPGLIPLAGVTINAGACASPMVG